MKRQASELKAGDMISVCGIAVVLDQVHQFDYMKISDTVGFPSCVLMFFIDPRGGAMQSLSVEPHVKFLVLKEGAKNAGT